MDERDEENQEESVEIPVNVDEEDDQGQTLGEETSDLESEEESLGGETSSEAAGGDPEETEPPGGEQAERSEAESQPEPAGDEELDDLYVSPDESDVEVVEPAAEQSAGEESPEEQTREEGEPAGSGSEDDEAATPSEPDERTTADGPTREELLERVDELEQEVDQLQQERDEYEERMLRAAADLENFRKRAKREKDELKKYGAKPLLEDLIQNIDNLERALEHADSSNEQNIIEGVEMVLRQLHTNLEKHGIEQFDSEGEQFDPEQHEAIQQVETTDRESGTIVEEFQKGYFLHDRLLRPAMVSVADNVAGDSEPEEDEPAADAEVDEESADGSEGSEPAEEQAEDAGERPEHQQDEDPEQPADEVSSS